MSKASLNIIGVYGLFFFIVGYARVRKDLARCQFEKIAKAGARKPGRGTVLRGLTEQETDFFQGFRKGVFARHLVCLPVSNVDVKKVFNCSPRYLRQARFLARR